MKNRIDHEPAFLLSSMSWRESSLKIDIFSQNYGRMSLIARSARRRQSDLRGVLVPFVPISLSWFGGNELQTLHKAEWLGGWAQPTGKNLLSAMYVNELILKFTAAADPHPEIYDLLKRTMQALSVGNHIQAALRLFEGQLLTACGFAPDIQYDSQGKPINADNLYAIYPEQAIECVPTVLPNTLCVSGETLIALANGKFNHKEALNQALQINRLLITHKLTEMHHQNATIHSRTVLTQLKHFQAA